MNTKENFAGRAAAPCGAPWLPTTLLALAILIAPARAEISEPDNLLYGVIIIGTNQVTAARSDVVIEARRTPTGAAIASYRMGTNPGLGSFYELRVPVEALRPLTNANASLAGDTLHIVLRDAAGVQGQATYTIPERGAVLRVNFGLPVSDSDRNGLPDVWEIARLGGTGQNPNADSDGDGESNLNEWIAGTDPRDRNDAFHLTVAQTGDQIEVAFVALRATGPGYEGVTRVYSLHSSTGIDSGPWLGLPGLTNFPGAGQTVRHQSQVSGTNRTVLYRGTVRLQ